MKSNFYAIVTAGGSGIRLGSSVPKQFLELTDGKCILQMSIEKFIEACPDVSIVTVLPKAWTDKWKEYCLSHNFQCPQMLVEGGITRFHSVQNALRRIPEGSIVAVHDAARPFISVDLIRKMLGMMEHERAVVPVIPVTDTLKMIKRTDDSLVRMNIEAPDRSCVFGAQTPQIFHSEDLKAAYGRAYDLRFTDDASVAESIGIPVTYVEGEKFNIKITTREDLVFADAIVRGQGR